MLRIVLILSSICTLFSTQACDSQGKTGFLPENDMYIGVYEKNSNGMDETTFNEVIDKVLKYYTPIVADMGADLVVERNWEDGMVNAYAYQDGSTWNVAMFGGLARHSAITEDGFALVVCHELGHHIGGSPKKDAQWASNEGQADYFATTKCLRRSFQNDDNQLIVSRMIIPQHVTDMCEQKFFSSKEISICQRGTMAGYSTAKLFAGNSELPKFTTPDPTIVTEHYHDHPQAQCRLDTYFQGALCDVKFDIDVDLNGGNAEMGLYNRVDGVTVGVRPLCWYKPDGITNGQTDLEYAVDNFLTLVEQGSTRLVVLALDSNLVNVNMLDDNSQTPLMIALFNNHVEIVRALLDRPMVDVNHRSDYDWEALMYASRYSTDVAVELLLQREEIKINSINRNGWSALHMAARGSDSSGDAVRKLELLLGAKGIVVNSQVNDGFSAIDLSLYYASDNDGDLSLFNVLLKSEALDLSTPNKDGKTTLAIAFERKQYQSVREIIKLGRTTGNSFELFQAAFNDGDDSFISELLTNNLIDINGRSGNKTILSILLTAHRDELVELVLQRSDLDATATFGDANRTALLDLIFKKNASLALKFLSRDDVNLSYRDAQGFNVLDALVYNSDEPSLLIVLKETLGNALVDVNAVDADGWNALMLAAEQSRNEAFKLLLEVEGIDYNSKKSDGMNPFLISVNEGNVSNVKLLLSMPELDTLVKNNDGKNAFELAYDAQNVDVFNIVIDLPGTDINQRNEEGANLLHRAIIDSKFQIINALVQNDELNINARDHAGWSALDRLIKISDQDVIFEIILKIFSRKDWRVNDQDNDGWNALILTTEHGKIRVLRELIRLDGIEIDLTRNSGDTALHTAIRKQNLQMVKILLEAGADALKESSEGWNASKLARKLKFKEIKKYIKKWVRDH